MAEEKKIATGYIGNALRSAANDHTTTFADEIFDTERQQYQNKVNTDLEQSVEAETARATEAEEALGDAADIEHNTYMFDRGMYSDFVNGWYKTSGSFSAAEGKLATKRIKVVPNSVISYTGSYGGSAAGVLFYDKEGNIISVTNKTDLGMVSEELTVPENCEYMVCSSFITTLNVSPKNPIASSKLVDEKIAAETARATEAEEALGDAADIEHNTYMFDRGMYSDFVNGWYKTSGSFIAAEGKLATKRIKVVPNSVILYTGSYGGAAAGVLFYDKEGNIISVTSKTDLEMVSEELTVPENCEYMVCSSFTTTLNVSPKNPIALSELVDEKVAVETARAKAAEEALEKVIIPSYSLNKKFKKIDSNNIEDIDKAIVFAGIVPFENYKGDDIAINVLSAYYNSPQSENTPTRFDVWFYNVTRSKDCYNYINKNIDSAERYIKIRKETEFGIIYAIIDTEVLVNHTNSEGLYAPIIFGSRSLILKPYQSNLPFLSDSIWIIPKPEPEPEPKRPFTIAWYGTSIPAGSYPKIVGSILGIKVYNEAVGESLVRLGWGKNCIAKGDEIDKWGCSGTDTSLFNPISNTIVALVKSLSATIEEKQYLIDNLSHFLNITGNTIDRERYTDEVIKGFSFENKLLKYIDSSREDYIQTDLIVFDHGHNDLNPDGDPKWNTYDIANRNKDNYWGAMNFLMDTIRKYNPHQMVCQISHYQGDVDYSANFYKAQQQFAEHWGIPFMELYKLTQMSTKEQFRTNGYWGYTDGLWHNNGFVFTDNGNGTYTTNQSCIIQYDFGINNGTYDANTQLFTSNQLETLPQTTQNRDIKNIDGVNTCLLKPREMFMKDRLHPLSDKSGNANNTIARLLAAWINSTYNINYTY